MPALWLCCVAEFVGTWLLVFLGCGAVHAAVLTGSLSGTGQVAIVWGVAIMAAAFSCGGVSGAHINPAITIAHAVWGLFPWRRVAAYLASQLAGAFVAAAALFFMFGPLLSLKEEKLGVTRGQAGSEQTAMCYGEYYPAPGGMPVTITTGMAVTAEVLGTLVLALVVAAVSDKRNPMDAGRLGPVIIGLTVMALISVIAPLTQACFNPARDFGPRAFAYLAGWGRIAYPGPPGQATLLVYAIAPIAGAVAGTGLYRVVLRSLWAEAPAAANRVEAGK